MVYHFSIGRAVEEEPADLPLLIIIIIKKIPLLGGGGTPTLNVLINVPININIINVP